MTSWADEQRQAPTSCCSPCRHDLDIVLGIWLPGHLYGGWLLAQPPVVLRALGSPDFGVMFSTYLGYWLMGAC